MSANVRQEVSKLETRPADCTCDGYHTSGYGPGISDDDIAVDIAVSSMFGTCPAELRAMRRAYASRLGIGR